MYLYKEKKKKNTLPTSIYPTDMIILQFCFVSRPLVGLYSGSFDWVDQNMMYIWCALSQYMVMWSNKAYLIKILPNSPSICPLYKFYFHHLFPLNHSQPWGQATKAEALCHSVSSLLGHDFLIWYSSLYFMIQKYLTLRLLDKSCRLRQGLSCRF